MSRNGRPDEGPPLGSPPPWMDVDWPRLTVVDPPPKGPAPLPPCAWEIGEQEIPAPRVYATPFPELDEHFGGGLSTGSTTIVVARTGAGKTGFVSGLGLRVLREHHVPFLYASSELDANECFARFGALELGVGHGDVYLGRIPRELATGALRGLPIHILDRRALRCPDPIGNLHNHIKRLSDHYGIPPVVCVDFLQNLVADQTEATIRVGVSQLAGQLRDLGCDCGVALLLVSSTGRSFYRPPKEGADDPITYLSAAKESGDIEYACSNMVFLDVAGDHTGGHYPARLAVPKARRGTKGFVGAQFHGPSGRWQPSRDSLAALDARSRAQAEAQKDAAEMDARVLAQIAKRPGLPWRTLRENCGNKAKADAARDRLIQAGKIEAIEQAYSDGLKRARKRVVIELRTQPVLPIGGSE